MLSRVWKSTVHDGIKIYKSSFTCKKMHFFGHNINPVHALDDLQVFKIPYPLEDTSLIMQKLHGVRQCSRPQWCSSSMPTRFTSVAISSWTNILEQDHTHQPFHSFAHVSCKASSCVQAPTCQGCNFSKKSSYFRHTLPLRLARSSIIYPSSHKHGSAKMGPSNKSYLSKNSHVPFSCL